MKNALTALALLAIPATAMADDQLSMTTGFDYSSGTYGNSQSTQILYIPVTAKYETGDWTAKLTVPYIRVTGPGGVLQGFGRVATPGAPATGGPGLGRNAGGGTSTNSGLGDIIASLGRTVYDSPDETFSLDLVGKVKFGTADANKGLGTGKNDYSAQLDGTYMLSDATSLLGTAGYKIVGAPTGIAVNNVFFGSAGVDHATSDTANVGVMLDYVQKITAAGYAQEDAMVYASEKTSSTTKIMGYLLKGFSYGSPDYGVGATITGYF
jgi:Putative MetA-pathway of phenol degradation